MTIRPLLPLALLATFALASCEKDNGVSPTQSALLETRWLLASVDNAPVSLSSYSGTSRSYIEFVGMKGEGMYSKTDLYALGPKFALPVDVILGEQDLISTPEVARAWFDTLQAPDKAFVLLPRTGHDPNPAMAAAQLEILKTKVLPRIGKGG